MFDLTIDHWYLPIQTSVAYSAVLGYPGYGEIFTGLGIQNRFSAKDRFQGFLQMLIGSNATSIEFKPSIGINYSLSDNLALYSQFGREFSLNKYNYYSLGLGLTYRFSLPDTPLN